MLVAFKVRVLRAIQGFPLSLSLSAPFSLWHRLHSWLFTKIVVFCSSFKMSGDFPGFKSSHSLVAKHVPKETWDKLKDIVTKTSGFTLKKVASLAFNDGVKKINVKSALQKF